jgi:hypothetical protein
MRAKTAMARGRRRSCSGEEVVSVLDVVLLRVAAGRVEKLGGMGVAATVGAVDAAGVAAAGAGDAGLEGGTATREGNCPASSWS